MLGNFGCFISLVMSLSCGSPDSRPANKGLALAPSSTVSYPRPDSTGWNIDKVAPADLITFARSLLGTRYRYGSTNPLKGFDCSGFITYVFKHFEIPVPRSSVDFTHMQHEVKLKDARPGDLVLFTGTHRGARKVGHIGIIISEPGEDVKFIHSTSGKAHGVTETEMDNYYLGRYVKVVRLFAQNDKI